MLRKLNNESKRDYSLPKSYRVITLLNCLEKTAKKIIASRLSYLAETTDLLYLDQIGSRARKLAIDAVLLLIYDI